MLIEDGAGSGYKAAVTPENQLNVCAITRTIDFYCNQRDKNSYSCIINETPTTSGSCFCYIKNNYSKDMVMSSIKTYCVSDDVININLDCLGIPLDGFDNTFVSREAGSGSVAEVTCKVGSNIIGLSGGEVVESIVIKGGQSSQRYEWVSGIVIPKNHAVCLSAETGSDPIRATLSIHFCGCS